MLSVYFRLPIYTVYVVLNGKGLETQKRAYGTDNPLVPVRPGDALSFRIKGRNQLGLLLGLHPRAKEKL